MKDLRCEIICVGSEILLGDIVNTNSRFIARELASMGVGVYYHTSVGDNFNRIIDSIDMAFKRGMNVVITTGGLGPTDDDITKEASSKYFEKNLILNEDCLKDLKQVLKTSDITEANLKQAYVPEGSDYIKNDFGTAPGIIFECDGKILINLPGPPRELYKMFDKVKIYLGKFTDKKYYSEILKLSEVEEGDINKDLTDLFQSESPTLGIYSKGDHIDLRITVDCKNDLDGKNLIASFKEEIYKRVGEFIFHEGTEEIEELLYSELLKRDFKISFGESCTGGMASSRFVNLSGASKCFNESFVTYSNEAKINNLGVSREVIEKFGAVSFETAKEMVEGLSRKTHSEVCVSITGVAGPNGSENKPAGLVYIGVKVLDKVYVKKFNFLGDRDLVRRRSSFEALKAAYMILKNL